MIYFPKYMKQSVVITLNRQYNHLMNQYVVARNVLISIADQTCPGLNEVFTNPRKADGRIKWAEVYRRFWHCEYITGFSRNKFISLYNDWCVKNGFRGSDKKHPNYTFLPRNVSLHFQNQNTPKKS